MSRSALKKLRSASTARSYTVDRAEFLAAVEAAVEKLPGWALARSSDGEVRATRRTRMFGFVDDTTVRFASLPDGGTHAVFVSVSRIGIWDLGQNGRNLKELLAAIDDELIARELEKKS